MKALIVSGGEKPSRELLRNISSECDLIIGADHGCDVLAGENIIPSYIVGDFDSADLSMVNYLESCGSVKMQFNKEKDFTDSEIALELALKEGAEEIIFLAVTGTRLDHTFGNLGLVLKAVDNGVKAAIINDNNKILILKKSDSLKKESNFKYISFLAYGKTVENLTIRGAKYSLKNYDLKIGDSMTVSNEFNDEMIDVSFDNGVLLAIYSKD